MCSWGQGFFLVIERVFILISLILNMHWYCVNISIGRTQSVLSIGSLILRYKSNGEWIMEVVSRSLLSFSHLPPHPPYPRVIWSQIAFPSISLLRGSQHCFTKHLRLLQNGEQHILAGEPTWSGVGWGIVTPSQPLLCIQTISISILSETDIYQPWVLCCCPEIQYQWR